MSRKSLTKKEPAALWFLCANCNAHIFARDREQHSTGEQCIVLQQCGKDTQKQINCTFVRDKKLHSNQLMIKPVTDDLRGITAKNLNNLIFLNESIFTLCDFVLGDLVLVASTALPNNTTIVRSVWPLSNSNAVSVSEDEWKSTWKWTENSTIQIERLLGDVVPAGRISVESRDPQSVDETVWPDLKKVLGAHIKGSVFSVNNETTINFFNKHFSFTIKEISVHPTVTQLDNLIDQFKAIHLASENYYLVTNSTALEFYKPKTNAIDDAQSSRVLKINKIGGIDEILTQLQDHMNVALGNVQTGSSFFVPRSILLSGQHGSGKTLLCDALTETSDVLTIKITASEIFSKYFGETELKLLGYFEQAYKNHPNPTILIIEEVSSICPKETKEESARRVQMAFLNILDEIHVRKDANRLFLIATTSNVDSVHLAVRRYGRLDVEIDLPVPDPKARECILLKQLQQVTHNLTGDDIKTIAANSHGFIAADLSNLIAKAAMHAVRKDLSQTPLIELPDIQFAYGQVVPSAMKEVVIKCPNVKWSDIGGQDELKLQLKQAIEWPLLHPETFTRLGITPPRGILMFGPPGCSKTMIAKALATESQVNFLSIKGPELFSMWVGESERAVRDLFLKARQVAPAIIFFDEIDAIGGERSASASGSSVKERVLTQLLTEMDGVNALTNVTIVAATNRPDLIDKAIMRPGRLDRIVYVRLPDAQTRREIFRIKLSKMPLGPDVDVDLMVRQTDGYSGAEIQAICQEAAMYALEVDLNAAVINWKYFVKAIENVKPRTSPELLKLYDDYLNEKLRA